MSATEESAAQKAARLRRERREAKIKAGGTERLQRISGLNGRAATFNTSPSPSLSARSSPAPQTPTAEQQQPLQQPRPQIRTPNLEDQSLENIKAQEEYLHALLRSQTALGPGPSLTQEQSQPQDPTAKLLSTLLGGNQDGFPGAIPGLGGMGGGGGGAGEGDIPEFSPSNLASALGIPKPLASLFTRQTKPETPEEQKWNSIFKIIHLVFSLVMGWYLLSSLGTAESLYGPDPPPPSTAQSPFVMFVTLEVVLAGIRVGGRVKDGEWKDAKMWLKVLGDVTRDGKIVVFLLGMWSLFSDSGMAR